MQYLLLYLWPKFLKKTFKVVHTYYRSFSGKIHIHMENLRNSLLLLQFLYTKFFEQIFLRTPTVAGERKINKIYLRKLKLGDRLSALEIAYWKLCLYGQLFRIRQTSQFSLFYRVWPAELCALLTNIFNKLIINSDANLRPPQQELFLTLVNAVNYCHKEIYYRCCRGPRYASETSYYRKI